MNKFSYIDHVTLARGILMRWNNDVPAAAAAWRRLFQNNCDDQQFIDLVGHADHTEFCNGNCARHSSKYDD